MDKSNPVETPVKAELQRHSAAHIMAEAVQAFFPGARFGIGPAIEDGFYYDFDLSRPLTPDDLSAIEAKMREIVASNQPFVRQEVDKHAARTMFAAQPYKLELIEELPDEKLTVYTQGSFTDLCRGPHVATTGEVKAFKLTTIAGAYWRGDEHRPMLQRIYGVAFPSKKELDEHLKRLEEAARRDHRKLGKELDLFSIHEEAGTGLVYWHPKGALIRSIIEDFWRSEHRKRGYDLVFIPHVARSELWQKSGHLDYYKENMFSGLEMEGLTYVVKPMNCPGHILIYKSRMRSYRELPLRWAELGTVYRWERSGVLHGLTRVRGFTQDDAHIFCRPDQLEQEVMGVIEFAIFMLKTFGFQDYAVYLSTRPDKAVGTLEMWEQATATLKSSLERLAVPYTVDPGEGVFYGPKVDIKLKDAIGRYWQGPTIQVDFNLPQRFDVTYTGADGQEHNAVMVHRVVLGSMERFFGCLIEHYAGAFPLWLAPVQVAIIPIADRHVEYAQKLQSILRADSIRADVDVRSERMNMKIRDAQMQKVPCMVIVGDNEVAQQTISVRLRSGENLQGQTIEKLKNDILKAVAEKSM